MERRAMGLARGGPETPAVLLDHDAGEPEAYARGGRLGREERIENVFELLRREADARIADLQQHARAVRTPRPDPDAPERSAGRGDGIDRVGQQIDHDALYPRAIAKDGGQSLVE